MHVSKRGRRGQLIIFSTFNSTSAQCAIFADIKSFLRHRSSACTLFANWLLGSINTDIELAAVAKRIDGAQVDCSFRTGFWMIDQSSMISDPKQAGESTILQETGSHSSQTQENSSTTARSRHRLRLASRAAIVRRRMFTSSCGASGNKCCDASQVCSEQHLQTCGRTQFLLLRSHCFCPQSCRIVDVSTYRSSLL